MTHQKVLEHIAILWFERRHPEENSVIRLKSNILPPPIFGLVMLLLAGPSVKSKVSALPPC